MTSFIKLPVCAYINVSRFLGLEERFRNTRLHILSERSNVDVDLNVFQFFTRNRKKEGEILAKHKKFQPPLFDSLQASKTSAQDPAILEFSLLSPVNKARVSTS